MFGNLALQFRKLQRSLHEPLSVASRLKQGKTSLVEVNENHTRRKRGGGLLPPKLGRNPFHSGKFSERTIGNSGRKFIDCLQLPKFDVLLRA